MVARRLQVSPQARQEALRRAVLGPPGAIVRLTAGQQRALARRAALAEAQRAVLANQTVLLTEPQRRLLVEAAVGGDVGSLGALSQGAQAGDQWCAGVCAALAAVARTP